MPVRHSFDHLVGSNEQHVRHGKAERVPSVLRSLVVATILLICPLQVQAAETRSWDEILAAARGPTVYFHAWVGDERNNALIRWIGDQVRERFGVTRRDGCDAHLF
jgi:hypothetical protein